MACLMAGMVGCGGGPPAIFFPPRCFEAAGLEKGVSDHRHQGVSVQAGQGVAFEVIEAEFLLEVLMRLLANPSGLDRGVILLTLHERLDVDQRDQTNLVSTSDRHPAPVMARRAGFHRDDAGRLLAGVSNETPTG